ncbi:MAG: sensor histidine kinase [Mariprofundaceae bacterium]
MNRKAPIPNHVSRRRLEISPRRLLHAFAYVLATILALGVFFVALLLAESFLYAITGRPVSTLAIVIAVLAAVSLYAPLIRLFERGLDWAFFRRHLNIVTAIQQLGAGDLADMPMQDVEQALLSRICTLTRRISASLDERLTEGRQVHCYPQEYPSPPYIEHPPQRLSKNEAYELCIKLPQRRGDAYLFLGPHVDHWRTMDDEIRSIEGLAGFAAMSLEHARLSQMHANNARLDSIHRVVSQLHSHDLKNRLHDLSFLAHNLQSAKLRKNDIQGLVQAVRKVVDRMQILMNRLADPSAPLHPELKPMDASLFIKTCTEERLWPEEVSIHIHTLESPMIRADAEMLHSVMDTLFDNAVQAMQGSGDLSVKVSSTDRQLRIEVKDSGCGMSPDFIERRLFHLFTSSKANGLGIGLFLSRRIIETHGGTIGAESEGEGKGCTFWIMLPLWQS